MRIQYVGGATVRLAYEHRWGPENAWSCEISDREQVKELLTQPGVDFVVSPDDPLAMIIGQEKAAELALEDVQTPGEWRARDRKKRTGETIVAPIRARIRAWREEVGAPAEEVDMDDASA